MRKTILALTVGAAALMCTGGAMATDTRTLSEFLSACSRDSRTCHMNLEDYLRAARDQGFVCPPQDLSLAEGGSQELSWLRAHRDS